MLALRHRKWLNSLKIHTFQQERNAGLPDNVQSRVQIRFTYPATWLTAWRTQELYVHPTVRKWYHLHITYMFTCTHSVSQCQTKKKGKNVEKCILTDLHFKIIYIYRYRTVINNKDRCFSTITLRWASINTKLRKCMIIPKHVRHLIEQQTSERKKDTGCTINTEQ